MAQAGMVEAMAVVDTAMEETKVPTIITDPVMVARTMAPAMVPAMAPAMAPATTKNKNAILPTKSIAPTRRNRNVNIHTKP